MECAMRTYRGCVARHPVYGITRGLIRERLLATLADGAPAPICGSRVLRRHTLDLHHTDAAVR